MALPALHSALRYVRRTAESADTRTLTDRQLLHRYRYHRDAAAFAALVRRHSRLVFSAVRHVLSDPADIDDAFQATFLVLVRKTGTVRWQPSIGNWLYGVAHRVAVRARARALRRKSVESRAGKRTTAHEPADLSWKEAVGVLHEELDLLPDKFRLPLLLCYLECQSRDEAAAQLGCSANTLKGRLETGRKRLRARLTRRGVELSAGLLAVLTGGPSRAVSPLLTRAAAQLAGGPASAAVVALANGAAVGVGPVKLVTGVLLAVGLLTGTVAGLTEAGTTALAPAPAVAATGAAPRDERPPAVTKQTEPAAAESISYGGRVLGPDGQPVNGATVYAKSKRGSPWHRSQGREYAKTGPDGRFAFVVPKAQFDERFTVVVAAVAANHGAAWVEVPADGKTNDLTIRMVRDDVPITGRIVDLEGKPVAGATLTVMQVSAAPDGNLGLWLEAIKDKQGRSGQLELDYLSRYTTALPLKATTDANGRFRLTGIGRDHLVRAQLDGPTIASQDLRILTRPGPTIEATEFAGNPEYKDPRRVTTYYGADFRHVSASTRPIVGVVRDKDTKKPLAGFSIRSLRLANHPLNYTDDQEPVRTTTDVHGRYRLVGLPITAGNVLRVVRADDMPYPAVNMEVPINPGLDPVTLDIEMKRGVWIEVKITDKVTGQPLRAGGYYVPLDSNPNRRDYPGVEAFPHEAGSVKDGSYRVVGLLGPGRIVVGTPKNHYLRATQRDDEFRITGPDQEGVGPSLYGSSCGAFARVDPPPGVESVRRDITLIPGWKFIGTVVGPDGQPLPGTENFALGGSQWDREATKTAEFTAWFNPHEPYEIICRHPEKRLVGATLPPKENGGSVTVRMEPAATVTGRLVDADGKPRAGVDLRVMFQPKRSGGRYDYLPEPVKTDANGRFRIEMLLPGLDYRLNSDHAEIPFGSGLRAGETKDLSDVRIRRE